MRTANFAVVVSTDESLTIKDLGPWNQFPSVTNDAENVVAILMARGLLKPGQRLLYYDSYGVLDELLVKDGKFAGFAPGPRVT